MRVTREKVRILERELGNARERNCGIGFLGYVDSWSL